MPSGVDAQAGGGLDELTLDLTMAEPVQQGEDVALNCIGERCYEPPSLRWADSSAFVLPNVRGKPRAAAGRAGRVAQDYYMRHAAGAA